MAIEYGPQHGGMRVGVDTWWEGDPNHQAVTVRARFYAGSVSHGYDDNQTMHLTGLFTEDVAYRMSSPWSGTVDQLVAERATAVGLQFGSTTVVALAGRISGAYDGSAPSHTRHLTLPAIPHLLPRPVPWCANTLTGSNILVQWGHDADGSSGPSPVYGFHVDRWDNVTGAWSRVASPAWPASSWTDTSAAENRACRYRVAAWNSTGAGPAATAGTTVRTKPAAASGVVATRDGANIVVAWTDNARSDTTWDIQWAVNGATATPAQVDDAVAGDDAVTGQKSWTAPTPDPSGSHQFRVRPRNPDITGDWSAWSNTLLLLAAPSAPTGLAVVPSPADATESLTFAWSHNSVDGTPQTAAEVRRRVQGTSNWISMGKVVTPGPITLHANRLVNGKVYEWSVRTWGDHADRSPWAATAAFVTSARPVVTITGPATPLLTNTATLAWSFTDPDGGAQAGFRVWLRDGGETGAILESADAAGAATSHTFATILADGVTVTAQVQARDTTGQWSTLRSLTIPVGYAGPPAPDVTEPVWDQADGSATLAWTVPEPGSEEVDAETVTVQMSVDNGATWELVADGLPTAGSVTTHTALVGGATLFKVTSVSALETSRAADPVTLDTTDLHGSWTYLGAGPGFAETARFRRGVDVKTTEARAKALIQFAGRAQPVEFAGTARERALNVAFVADKESASLSEIAAVADRTAPLCYRDPGTSTGQPPTRVFVSALGLGRDYHGIRSTGTLSLEEVGR